METIIVSRHKGAVEWLRRRGFDAPVVEHVTDTEQIRGKIVIGNVPLHLAVQAAQVWSIQIPNLPADKRGQDLSADELDEYGAYLLLTVVLPQALFEELLGLAWDGACAYYQEVSDAVEELFDRYRGYLAERWKS